MKKLLYCAAALATMFFTACQQENLEPAEKGSTVSFSVEVPGLAVTKADVVDNGSNINDLVYAVYKVSDEATTLEEAVDAWSTAERIYQVNQTTTDFTGGRTKVDVELLNDQNYVVLFWAQVNDAWVAAGNDFDLTNITYPNNPNKMSSSNSDLAAFSGATFVAGDDVEKNINREVILTRPFAQINIGTTLPKAFTVSFVDSKVTVRNAGKSFNVASQTVTGNKEVVFAESALPSNYLTVQGDATNYTYVAMNYVFANGVVEVEYDINTNYGKVNKIIPAVPVEKNFRTNIIGNLLTSNAEYKIVLDADFQTNNNNDFMEVISDGVVKNLYGDYEVIDANGLAYAINHLFAEGGNFYLTEALYDMAGYEVNPPTVPAGKVLNVYGEIPVVTRAAAVTKATIVGLDAPIILTNNGAASFSGVAIQGTDENADSPAFIETNNGTVDFTGCETTTQDFIGENTGTVTESDNTTSADNTIVSEDKGESLTKVATADELVVALAAGKGVLFTEDITVAASKGGYNKAGILQNKAQTIDGGDHTLTVTGAGATWDCAIYTNGGLIKNLTVTGAMRGIFTAGTSADLYIDNVKFKNVVYTFNSDGGNTNYGVYVSNSTINGWTSHSDVHKEVVYTNCSFGKGSGYAFCRPYGLTKFVNCEFAEGYTMDPRGKVSFTNCTLNGVALTDANYTDLVTSNSGNAAVTAVVSTADELVAALEDGRDVLFANDIKIEPASMSNAYGATGVNVKNGQTIDGNGYTLNIKGAGGTWDSGINTTGGLIKNITVTGSFRGIFINHTSDHSEKVVLENVTLEGVTYTISCDQGMYQGIEATNCTFNGWTSFAKTAGEAKFVNCNFGEGSGYKYCRPYSNTEFVGCTFCPGYAVDTTRATVTFTDCIWEE